MLNYRRTTQFKKDYKQQIRRGKDNNKIDAIINLRVARQCLPPSVYAGVRASRPRKRAWLSVRPWML